MVSPRVVLVGPMASGKTTVGQLVADLLGVELVDVDQHVVSRSGMPIADLFETHGEEFFREVEKQSVEEVLATHDGVVALGGGAVTHQETRDALRGHTVVFLDVNVEAAMDRTRGDDSRPLLRGNPVENWRRITTQRRPLYEEVATSTVSTSGREPAAIARDVINEIRRAEDLSRGTQRIAVGSGEGAYDVLVGRGLTAHLPEVLGASVQRVLLVSSDRLAALSDPVGAVLTEAGYEVVAAVVPDAEAAKTTTTAAELYSALGRAGFTRTDAVVAVGGGTVTDLAGFVAATWLRGIRVVHVPTTVLGMVDAAVGGKTGVNTTEGKNLVGAFHPPAAVLCDLDTLSSLPAPDVVAGLAEVVKTGFIADPVILDLVEASPSDALDVTSPELAELITRSIAVKARVVTEDLKEASLREILNYGHTFGHAVEQVEHYTRRHGEAVAIGMMYAVTLGASTGHGDAAFIERHRRILEALGLPTRYVPGRWPELYAAMRRDKKTRGSMLRFVVLDEVAAPTRLSGPGEDQLEAAYRAISGS